MTSELKEELQGFLQKDTPNGRLTISASDTFKHKSDIDLPTSYSKIMNITCPSGGNSTVCASDGKSEIALFAGLAVLFLALLLVGIAATLWFRHRKSVANIELSNKLNSRDKSHDGHSRESPYSGYAGGLQPAPQSPIYENFQSAQSNLHNFQSRAVQNMDTSSDHQAYRQCDSPDAIYSNDPALFHPDQAEISEDVYIMPDA